MKGKGKGERSGGSSSDRERSSSESKDSGLQFPDLKPVDHARHCPRYTAVLQRTEEDGIGIEELDTLQTELETLLASVAKRMRQLESETSILSNLQDSKGLPAPTGKPEKSRGKSQPEGKRSAGKGEDRASKRFRGIDGKSTFPPSSSKAKGKQQTVKDFDFPDSPKPKELPKLPKNDAANRFWASVEPYCQEITNEDLKVLEDLLRSHEDDVEYHKVPGLGKHYSHKWAQEDMLEEQKEGRANKSIEKRRSASNSSNSTNSDATTLLKKAAEEKNNVTEFPLPLDFNSDDDSSPFGPLTQRLVSALIEENIMTPLEDASIETDAAEAATMSPRSLAKQLNVGNTAQLERRIRRELEEQGIFEIDDRADENPEDEILSELRRKQQELRTLSQHNLILTKRIYKMAKDEITRQELRKKLSAADSEVINAYQRIQNAKQKKKTPTKKEKDGAFKSLKERESIIRQLEGMSY